MKNHQHSDHLQHEHDHDHHRDHHHHHDIAMDGPPTRAFQLSILINLLFVFVEIYYGYFSNSLSLMADAGHNLGDVFALVLSWLGYRLSRSQPSSRFSFGLKKFSILAALINALVLVLGSFWILKEAYERFYSTQPQDGPVMMAVALVGIVINFGSALLFRQSQQSDLNMKSAYLHLMGDALVSLGVVVAGFFIFWKNWSWVDPVLSAVIVFIILYGTWDLLKESVVLVLGGVPVSIDLQKVETFLKNLAGVLEVRDLKVWALSTSEYALAVKLVIEKTDAEFDFDDIQKQIQEKFKINFVTIQTMKTNSTLKV